MKNKDVKYGSLMINPGKFMLLVWWKTHHIPKGILLISLVELINLITARKSRRVITSLRILSLFPSEKEKKREEKRKEKRKQFSNPPKYPLISHNKITL